LKDENIQHLEVLRNNLEASLGDKTNALHEKSEVCLELTEKVNAASMKVEEVTKTNLRLKANLDLRAVESTKMNNENIRLVNELKEAVNKADDAVEFGKDVEKLRKNEEQVNKELRMKLQEAERKAEEGESAGRSLEAQQRLLMEAEGMVEKLKEEVNHWKLKTEEQFENVEQWKIRVNDASNDVKVWKERVEKAEIDACQQKEVAEQWRLKMAEVEAVMQDMEQRVEQLQEEAEYYKNQHAELKEMIEPFKDQLNAFEAEKRSILGMKDTAVGEMERLASQYASLLGHQNQKQKIHHVIKLKEEKHALMKEVAELKEQLSKSRKSFKRLEERYNEAQGIKRFDPRLSFQPGAAGLKETPNFRNKENKMHPPTETPLTSSKAPSRRTVSNALDRSPLNPINKK